MNIAEAIHSKCIPVPEAGCWLWLGTINPSGYGQAGIKGAPKLAHRASYEAFIGPIPHGLFVCHKCDTRSCVNPDHLFVGTHKDNMRDMWAKGRIYGQTLKHCHRGHEFTEENTRLLRGAHRECKECAREQTRDRTRAWRARKAAIVQTGARS